MPHSSCAASFCKNNRYNANKRELHITFHTFPPNGESNLMWAKFCNRGDNWTPKKNDVLCSVHFKEDDYQLIKSPLLKTSRSFRTLHANAVPTMLKSAPIAIEKKKRIDEKLRMQLTEELYNKTLDNDTTTNDHTYSEAKSDIEKKNLLNRVNTGIYRLQTFPDVCVHCLKAVDDEQPFIPIELYIDQLECTIEQKYDDLINDIQPREAYTINNGKASFLPKMICEACLETLMTFHQYQRQIECIRKFTCAIAQLLNGHQKPLENLYRNQGNYLINRLKSLDILHGSEDSGTLERLVEEMTLYQQVKTLHEESDVDYDEDNVFGQPLTNTGPEISAGRSVLTPYSFKKQKERRNLRNSKNQLMDSGEEYRANQLACPYKDICKETFSDETKKQRHIQEQHVSFECHICGNILPFYNLYQQHMESHAIARSLRLSYNSRKDNSPTTSITNQSSSSDNDNQRKKFSCYQRQMENSDQSYICGSCFCVYQHERDFMNHKCKPSANQAEHVNVRKFSTKHTSAKSASQSMYAGHLGKNLATSKRPRYNPEFLDIEILPDANKI